MTIASGAKTGLRYVLEAIFGVTPANPTFIQYRANFGIKPTIKRDTFPIKEIRSDRQISDLRYGNKQCALELPVSLSYATFDDMFEALLGGTWAANVLKSGNIFRSFSVELDSTDLNSVELYRGMAPSSFQLKVEPNKAVDGCSFSFVGKDFLIAETVGASCTISTATKTITRAAGDFIADGWKVGMNAKVDGGAAAGNASAVFTNLTAVTATVLTFTAITGGAPVNEGPITMDVHQASIATAVTPANSNPVFDSFTGAILEGGNPIAYVTGVDVKFESPLSPTFAIMQDSASSLSQGVINCTGTLTIYWVDQSIRKKFINGTSSTLSLTLGQGSKSYTILVPKLFYTGNDRTISEGPLTETAPFQAVLDSVSGTNMQITRTP